MDHFDIIGPAITIFIALFGIAVSFGILKKSDEMQEKDIYALRSKVADLMNRSDCKEMQKDCRVQVCKKIESQRQDIKETIMRLDNMSSEIIKNDVVVSALKKLMEDQVATLKSIELKMSRMEGTLSKDNQRN